MLHLMEIEGKKLDATIDLLKCTSVLIQHFRDSRPITDVTDEWLTQNLMPWTGS